MPSYRVGNTETVMKVQALVGRPILDVTRSKARDGSIYTAHTPTGHCYQVQPGNNKSLWLLLPLWLRKKTWHWFYESVRRTQLDRGKRHHA